MNPKSPLSELRRGVWPVQDAELEARRRERIAGRILTLNGELRARSLRRRPSAWIAAAALIGGLCGVWLIERPSNMGRGLEASFSEERVRLVAGAASVSRSGVLAPLGTDAFDVSAEPVLVTRADQGAELRLGSNTALQIAAASEVGLERRRSAGGFEERVHLRAGGVALRVPKLGAQGKVAVETRDSWIEVHGTRFSVRWVERAPLAPFTEVEVTEGKVLVRAHDGAPRMLGPGDTWHSDDAEPVHATPTPALPAAATEPAPPSSAAATTLSRPAPHPQPAAPRGVEAQPATPAPSPSELAAQNRLLEGAELARKSGLRAVALERLDTLIERYPESELAHNARVQRMRLLDNMGRSAEAASAARQYLELYPQGFARDEARQQLARKAGGTESSAPDTGGPRP